MDSAQPKEVEPQNEPQLGKHKRKEPKGFDIDFEVFKESENSMKDKYALKLVKPKQALDRITNFPSVCFMKESSDNKHAFDIMHNLHHPNILSLKLLAEETKGEDSVAAFVEPHDGVLWSILHLQDFVDNIDHVPSPKLQKILRQ